MTALKTRTTTPRNPPKQRPRARTTGRAPGTPAVGLVLPAALDAFHTLNRPRYDAYARAHLDPEAAQAAVRTAVGLLAANWNYVLAQPNPAALAWDQLVACTQSRTHPVPGIDTGNPLRYDARVLHDLMNQSIDTIAHATGHHPSKIRYLLEPRPLRAHHLLGNGG
ncbi:hypothetical protein [Streptomyces sp. NPDC013457]|uniref:hypothetical protein n=1 Tax=Streptomyces sp. NPDC013457 TaxID=3364866 RepID=UPI0036F8C417